jgi:hypothetical protein
VRIRFPLPTRSTNTQRPSRCWMRLDSSAGSSQPAQSAAQKHRQNRAVPFSFDSFDLGLSKQVASLACWADFQPPSFGMCRLPWYSSSLSTSSSSCSSDSPLERRLWALAAEFGRIFCDGSFGARDGRWMPGSRKAGTTTEGHKSGLEFWRSVFCPRLAKHASGEFCFLLTRDLHGCRQCGCYPRRASQLLK